MLNVAQTGKCTSKQEILLELHGTAPPANSAVLRENSLPESRRQLDQEALELKLKRIRLSNKNTKQVAHLERYPSQR